MSLFWGLSIFSSKSGFGQPFNYVGSYSPFVPEFNVQLVAYPYDVTSITITKTDPYTGKQTNVTTPGYHVENRSIEITIKNQPFTPYTDEEGHKINIYYDVRIKGHFEEKWKNVYTKYEGSHPVQSNSEYTILSLPANYPDEGLVDFQVQAITGYYYDELAGRPVLPLYVLGYVETSGWSNTQTLSVNFTEVIPEFPANIILPIFLSFSIAMIIGKNKIKEFLE
jgi:hypothetical protein